MKKNNMIFEQIKDVFIKQKFPIISPGKKKGVFYFGSEFERDDPTMRVMIIYNPGAKYVDLFMPNIAEFMETKAIEIYQLMNHINLNSFSAYLLIDEENIFVCRKYSFHINSSSLDKERFENMIVHFCGHAAFYNQLIQRFVYDDVDLDFIITDFEKWRREQRKTLFKDLKMNL